MVSVCLPSDALSQHLPSYLGFSPWTWGISSQLLQQSAAAAPYLGWEEAKYKVFESKKGTHFLSPGPQDGRGGETQESGIILLLFFPPCFTPSIVQKYKQGRAEAVWESVGSRNHES